MTRKNEHINKEDFRRYLEDQMTPAERNLFERELQKHPFETEALEGFQNINSNQFQKDLKELKVRIQQEKRKNYYRYWAAAASFLLIVATGIILFQLNEKTTIPKLAENKTEQKQEEQLVKPDEQKEIIQESEILQSQLSKEMIQVESKERTEINEVITQPKEPKKILKSESVPPVDKVDENAEIVVLNIAEDEIEISESEVEPTQEIVSARGFSQPVDSNTLLKVDGVAKAGNAIPLAFTSEAVQTNEEIPDSFAAFQAEKELPKMAATKSATKKHSAILVDSKALPEIGMQEFEKNMENEAILPDNHPNNKEVVKLILKINSKGEITEFQNENRADSLLFERSKEIIINGPKWQPEIKNGIPVDSETEIKIVFRK